MTQPDIADVFTADELWMLYGIAHVKVEELERDERQMMTNCGSAPWRSLKGKLRLQIERQRPEIASAIGAAHRRSRP